MIARFLVLISVLLIFACPAFAQDDVSSAAADSAMNSFWSRWVVGPETVQIGDMARLEFDDRFAFGHPEQARELLEFWENPSSGRELGCLTSSGPEDWFVFFEFDDIGYVKDDEKEDLDADAILESMIEGTKRGNEVRRDRGWSELELVGWAVEPTYNELTNNLEWGTIVESEGRQSVNYSVRILGRAGVMQVQLVCDVASLHTYLPAFRESLVGFNFNPGNTYAEFKEGDKIAEYGLAALVAGGALAGLAKAGILKKLLKPLIFGLVIAAGFFRRMLARLFGRGQADAA